MKTLADLVLDRGAVQLSPEKPFTWASGYRMPVYNDNRLLLASPEARQEIARGFEALIEEKKIEFDVLAGTATAGIPHATTLADRLKKPLCYVRSKAKDHGMGRQTEGLKPEELKGSRVLLIEDLISTGGSSIQAVEALRQEGARVSCCLAIFSYGFDKARQAFGALDPRCGFFPLLEWDFLVDRAVQKHYIESKDRESLVRWRRDPFAWGGKNNDV